MAYEPIDASMRTLRVSNRTAARGPDTPTRGVQVCRICKREKDLNEFYVQEGRRMTCCATCHKARCTISQRERRLRYRRNSIIPQQKVKRAMNQYTNPEKDQRSTIDLDREEDERIRRAEEHTRQVAKHEFADDRPFTVLAKTREPRWIVK